MPRTDAVQFFLELAAEWRRLGAEVTFEPGWERRGNGQSAAYEGGVVHHTAFLSSFANPFPAKGTLIGGRPDLSGPLANVGGPVCPVDRPWLHIIAAFPANHAGASGGRSMGPLPVTTLFNRMVVGLEIDYAGLTPMIGGQRRAALIFTRGLANVLARSVEYVRAHAETSVTGKWDPGVGNGKAQTIDMAAFRRDAAQLSGEDGLPVGAAEDIAYIKSVLIGGMNAAKGESNFHWLERNTRQFEVYRNNPAWGGSGEMVLAAPGFWYTIPNTVYLSIYISKGLCSPDFAECTPNEFTHLRDLHLLRMSSVPSADEIAKAVAAIPDDELPATLPTTIPMSEEQIEKLASLLDDEMAALWKEQLAEQAKATADEFDARERARLGAQTG